MFHPLREGYRGIFSGERVKLGYFFRGERKKRVFLSWREEDRGIFSGERGRRVFFSKERERTVFFFSRGRVRRVFLPWRERKKRVFLPWREEGEGISSVERERERYFFHGYLNLKIT